MILKSKATKNLGGWIRLLAVFATVTATVSAAGQTGNVKRPELYLGGQPDAPIKIEVFSDYQCPACRAFYLETLKPLIANYASVNKVYIVYHDLPLDMHPFARKAARFALAAHRISRERWLRVTDTLYSEQALWSQDGNLEAVLAKTLDPTEFSRIKRLAADPATDAAVEQEVMIAQSREVTSTPTFFVITQAGRQQRVNSGVPYPVLKDFIDRQIK
jgi:protein-disulfide isomerase